MQLDDFAYSLPPELIAQQPLAERSASRLLHLQTDGQIADLSFTALTDLLAPGDLLVFNDTKVFPARLFGQKITGGRVELLVEQLLPDSCRILAHLRASRAPQPDTELVFPEQRRAKIIGRQQDLFELEFFGSEPVLAYLERCGHMPLPPYIERADQAQDRQRYQTVYAKNTGAVAAPTAGLHFDQPLLTALAAKGIATTFVTLHVGAGTFQPIRTANIEQHIMHAEQLEVSQSCCAQIRQTQQQGGRIIAVGTTVVRSLETAAAGGELQPYTGTTQLFIRPGYRFRVIDGLITNFHLPKSTLLMLVCAFAGYAPVMQAYAHAVAQGYRFFSYGDAMLLWRA